MKMSENQLAVAKLGTEHEVTKFDVGQMGVGVLRLILANPCRWRNLVELVAPYVIGELSDILIIGCIRNSPLG